MKKNSQKKVLPFPTPLEELENSTVTIRIGNERFAIHFEIEDLPPAAPLLFLKRAAKKASAKRVK